MYQRVTKLLRWAIPPEMAPPDPRYRDALRTAILNWTMIIWGPVFAPVYYLLGSTHAALVIIGGSSTLVLLLPVLRWTKALRAVGNGIAGVVYGVLVLVALYTGGGGAASLCWLPSVPILALLLCGAWDAVVWVVCCLLAAGGLYLAGVWGLVLPDEVSPDARAFLYTLVVCGIVACAFLVTWAFKNGETATQRELEQARDASQRANQAKGQFLANMSHEIRTPMNAILGMTDLVLESQLDDDQRSYLRIARQAGSSLLTLLDDILDFSRVDAGKLQLVAEPFQLHKMLGDALKAVSFKMRGTDVALVCDIGPDVPRYVIGDAGRLRQVVLNLVDNGLKFTAHGQVVVQLRRRNLSGPQVTLEFTVSDTGIGIPLHKQAAVFNVFVQADNTHTRPFGGAGLGLTISSHLVQLMGGEIELQSDPGVGTTFTFTLPFSLADESDSSRRAAAVEFPVGRRVLLVATHPAERDVIGRMLSEWKLDVTELAQLPSSADGPEQPEPAAKGLETDLMVVDQQSLDRDGCRRLRDLRQSLAVPTPLLILVPSGQALTTPEMDCAADQRLLLPLIPEELRSAVARCWQLDAESEEELPERPARRAGRSLRVLLVEDSRVNQKLASIIVQKMGHEVVGADDGRQALSLWTQMHFDLVLMDVQMPVVDGLQATRAIRRKERTSDRHVPIIALTAHALPEDREACLQAGMDAVLTKPVTATALRRAINGLQLS